MLSLKRNLMLARTGKFLLFYFVCVCVLLVFLLMKKQESFRTQDKTKYLEDEYGRKEEEGQRK